jgi:protein-L-isoaspartate(D-aspartate) O-methyltransferase
VAAIWIVSEESALPATLAHHVRSLGEVWLGVPERAPFAGIAVAAAAPTVPTVLYSQLGEGGRIVVPRGTRRGQDLVLVTRTPAGPVERRSIPCRFVPLLGDEGFGPD